MSQSALTSFLDSISGDILVFAVGVNVDSRPFIFVYFLPCQNPPVIQMCCGPLTQFSDICYSGVNFLECCFPNDLFTALSPWSVWVINIRW